MNKREFDAAIDAMTVIAKMFTRGSEFYYWSLPRNYYLGGTPLDEALVMSIDKMRQFQKRANVEVLNAIVLSDGSSHRMEYFGSDMNGNVEPRYMRSRNTIRITDRKSGTQIQADSAAHRGAPRLTIALLELLKKSTGCNLVGFFLSSPRDFRYAYSEYISNDPFKYEDYRKQFMKDKFMLATDCGYDELYIIRAGKSLEIKDEGLDVDAGASRAKLTTAFKKMTKGKLQNRVILTKFVEKISKAA
jgi:hypothetical protein